MAPCKTCSWVQGLYREHTEPIVVFFVLGGAKNSSMSPPCRPSTATDEGEAPGGPSCLMQENSREVDNRRMGTPQLTNGSRVDVTRRVMYISSSNGSYHKIKHVL
ncbi:hypothetical protein D5086_017387 [Populus alba]|uniref:Uncharacterized protein n=1 Tax=Populus alba TaxID=43335 RepID=A0ACC4BWP6_POPAL